MNKSPSAGIVAYRLDSITKEPEFLLCYPGGPFYHDANGKKKNEREKWGIPKGKIEPGENVMCAAIREFQEETGLDLKLNHMGDFRGMKTLTPIKYTNGKVIHAWAFPFEVSDMSILHSNFHEMEYPKGSGVIIKYPEVSDYRYMKLDEAAKKCHSMQYKFLLQLYRLLKENR